MAEHRIRPCVYLTFTVLSEYSYFEHDSRFADNLSYSGYTIWWSTSQLPVSQCDGMCHAVLVAQPILWHFTSERARQCTHHFLPLTSYKIKFKVTFTFAYIERSCCTLFTLKITVSVRFINLFNNVCFHAHNLSDFLCI